LAIVIRLELIAHISKGGGGVGIDGGDEGVVLRIQAGEDVLLHLDVRDGPPRSGELRGKPLHLEDIHVSSEVPLLVFFLSIVIRRMSKEEYGLIPC
jgi:hypothetical protein